MRTFLTARWEHLLMLNYTCPPEVLNPYLPKGLELDIFQGKTLISLVGFKFLDTKVKGIPIPGHSNFEEVNLRFYVKRLTPQGETRRGVVFIREYVPKPIIAYVAKTLYDEPYETARMSHEVQIDKAGGSVNYEWRTQDQTFQLQATVTGSPEPLKEGSMEQFITEHYWGYTKRKSGETSEYQVTHPSWPCWSCDDACLVGDPTTLYGSEIGQFLNAPPDSALLSVGSKISVSHGVNIG